MIQLIVSAWTMVYGHMLDADLAAQYVAAEFNYFQDLSEAELTGLALELSRVYPERESWQWFDLLRSLRDYGVLLPDKKPKPPPDDDKDKKKAIYWSIAAGIIVIALLARSS